jgi:hypothetical protein
MITLYNNRDLMKPIKQSKKNKLVFVFVWNLFLGGENKVFTKTNLFYSGS